MQVPLVMTVIGKDRPGLIEAIANTVAAYGANWLESRMCRLGGEFAGILRIHVDAAQQPGLGKQLRALESQGLHVTVRATETLPPSTERIVTLELVGQDRPGIVREISHTLAKQGINVEELSTSCSSAPMSGETLFRAEARLQLPGECHVPELRKELERIGGNLLVDIKLHE